MGIEFVIFFSILDNTKSHEHLKGLFVTTQDNIKLSNKHQLNEPSKNQHVFYQQIMISFLKQYHILSHHISYNNPELMALCDHFHITHKYIFTQLYIPLVYYHFTHKNVHCWL